MVTHGVVLFLSWSAADSWLPQSKAAAKIAVGLEGWRTLYEGAVCPLPQVMGKNKVLVKVHPEGKYVVDLDKSIEMSKACSPPLCTILLSSLRCYARQEACQRAAHAAGRRAHARSVYLLLAAHLIPVPCTRAGDDRGARGAAQ